MTVSHLPEMMFGIISNRILHLQTRVLDVRKPLTYCLMSDVTDLI